MDGPPQDPPALIEPMALNPTQASTLEAKERELCDRASRTDWLYLGAVGALSVTSVMLDGAVAKYNDSVVVRMGGPAFIGLSVGALAGAVPLLVPQCDASGVVRRVALEGNTRSFWPLTITMAVVAAATAPFIVGIETGPIPAGWPVLERSGRLLSAGVGGAAGAFLPLLIPPGPWRARKALDALQLQASDQGAFVGFRGTF